MKPLESYCEKALEIGLEGARVIDPRSVVTAEWVRMKCQFGCFGYGRSHCCPPHTPTPDVTRKVINAYQKAILLHRRLVGEERSKELNDRMVRLEIEMFLDGYYKAWSMGAGPCRLCNECHPSEPCKQGMEARPSMEACGIDVYQTARENGFFIKVVTTKDEERNVFGLILVE